MRQARTEAKGKILEAVRGALVGAPAEEKAPRNYRFSSGLSHDDLKDQLIDRLEDYKANVILVSSPQDLPEVLAKTLFDAERILLPSGLDSALIAETGGEIFVDDPSEPLSLEQLDSVDVVLTESAAACSETGTIFLDASANQGRRAITLVPDRHVVIVRMENVRGLLPETLAMLESTRPLTWISGPSATSDIELERVEGVHGPRTLDVLLVDAKN